MESVYGYKKDCCGCGVCALICPGKYITMEKDEEGFKFPVINTDKCTDCSLCKKSCVFKNDYENNGNAPAIFALKHNDVNVRTQSSSGGAFSALADYVIGQGGVVFGCKLTEQLKVIHSHAQTKEACKDFRRSKYVESDLGGSFTEVKQFLEQERLVMFTGTPCQTAALRGYIGKNTDENNVKSSNLLTVDFVCHGVPSQLMFDEYIRFVETRTKKKVKNYYWRTKDNGWEGHINEIIFCDGTKDSKSKLSRLYKTIFLQNFGLRRSCGNCKYANFARPADITMGDYWGISKTIPGFYDDKGVSLVLVNTSNGQSFFDKISPNVTIKAAARTTVTSKRLRSPTEPNPQNERFWRDYHEKGFAYAVLKNTEQSLVRKCLKKGKAVLRKVLT